MKFGRDAIRFGGGGRKGGGGSGEGETGFKFTKVRLSTKLMVQERGKSFGHEGRFPIGSEQRKI